MKKVSPWVITGILALFVGFQIVALVEQAIAPDLSNGIPHFQTITTIVFQAVAPFSPLLIVLLLYSWAGRSLLKIVKQHDAHLILSERFRFLSRISRSLPVSWDTSGIPLLNRPIALLAIGIVSSFLLALTPYRPDINANALPVGIDTPEYIQWVSQMLQRPVPDALAYAFTQASSGSRPLSLLFPYAISGLFGTPADVSVEYYPLFLGPLLVLSSFMFMFLGHGDKRMAALVGLMTAFSFQLTVGIWAGYYANWLALAESYLLLGILLRFHKTKSKTSFAGLVILSLSLQFTHPWTWDLMILLSIVFIMEHSLKSRDFTTIKLTVLLVAINLIVDSIRSLALGGYGGSRAGLDIATSSTGFSQVIAFWPNVVALFVQNYNGIMADAVILALALTVEWRLLSTGGSFARLLVWWVVLASLPFPFLGSLLQSRIVYLLPIPVLASAAIIGLEKLGRSNPQRGLILLLLLFYAANYSLNAILQA